MKPEVCRVNKGTKGYKSKKLDESCLTISVLQLASEHVHRLDPLFSDIERIQET